ncbi:type II toxin-antitoxin system antitoxin SocA domain-containing protein [Cytophaga hutchinsonii]|uniref:Uncharacterized protein n=1 Tax=Cytophaga hutchinsonii (strain ATCC 33406 / DSM 1761 / CIP 103989 / NBRC 15051 / NCIMB 9469 / D465) TaxID=269798 RepID=A0A6N4SW46_CYTH3|nr:type II toxin-antitoxin system antitoxin SocA domain-containing protein [Cytophaga hutchinsonii]ABG60711.1 hypothetical protein CHU_3477 [Cytophaga hutchinsonii ATCC 33406]SFX70184.1 Protein of unknown function [Cytophaga hutchinsonii ATCC 33406]
MNNSEKILAFEYLLDKLKDWYTEIPNSNFNNNDFSKLKVLKLNFFAAAVNANKENNGLLNIFDKFHAMPYGHVESEVYENLNNLNFFSVSSNKTTINNNPDFEKLKQETRSEINFAIESLKKENNNLIKYSAMDLVELSHTYFSWRASFNLAKQQNKLSMPIPVEMIKTEKKFFIL